MYAKYSLITIKQFYLRLIEQFFLLFENKLLFRKPLHSRYYYDRLFCKIFLHFYFFLHSFHLKHSFHELLRRSSSFLFLCIRSWVKLFQRLFLKNIQRTHTHPSLTFPKSWRRTNTKDILRSHYHPNTKTRQRHYQKRNV